MSEVTLFICPNVVNSVVLPWALITFSILFTVDEAAASICTADAHCDQSKNNKDNQDSPNNPSNVQIIDFHVLPLTPGCACVIGSDAVVLPRVVLVDSTENLFQK